MRLRNALFAAAAVMAVASAPAVAQSKWLPPNKQQCSDWLAVQHANSPAELIDDMYAIGLETGLVMGAGNALSHSAASEITSRPSGELIALVTAECLRSPGEDLPLAIGTVTYREIQGARDSEYMRPGGSVK